MMVGGGIVVDEWFWDSVYVYCGVVYWDGVIFG